MSPERKGGSGSARKARVEAAMREALTEAIAADIRDPRVHAPTMLTVSRVEMNVDMSVARCYISIVGDDATADAAIEGLNKAAGFLRGPIGRRLRMQHAPELRFMIDPSLDVGAKLAAIVREDEEKARAAGRDPKAEAAAPASPDKKVGDS
ncbi:MAG TPA: 30S ribosome-binding factor RbfA [Kofleriaceae bacterium]|nr:30S ribosome-binding factor RbfA [Kofleriaceae bacterium]